MDLYALPPEEFTAARDAAAKNDRALKALRRPTVSAWVVNLLVRREPALVDALVALGADLAQAQQYGRGDALRTLGEQRRDLVRTVAGQAAGLTDRALSAAVRAEVEATLEAALADPASAEAVRTGRLVRPLAYAGFGVDLDGAVAPGPPPATASARATRRPAAGRDDARADKAWADKAGAAKAGAAKAGTAKAGTAKAGAGTARAGKAAAARAETARVEALRAAEQAAQAAAGHLDDVVREAEAAAGAHEAAETAATTAQADEERAEKELEQARDRRTGADRVLHEAAGAVGRARRDVGLAQATAEQARGTLDLLRRGR